MAPVGFWETARVLLAVLTPLVAVPLTIITFYLRSLREHQLTWHGQVLRRLELSEERSCRLQGKIDDVERDYTTKEEWLREVMTVRRQLEHLRESMVRVEASLQFIGAGGRLPPVPGTRPPGCEAAQATGSDAPDVTGVSDGQ